MPQSSTQGAPGDISDMYNPAAYGRLDEKEMLLAVKADSRVDVMAVLVELAGRRYVFKHKSHDQATIIEVYAT